MKRNLISVIILALSVINFILMLVIVFAVVPTAKKTNNLVTQISSAVKLDLNNSDDKKAKKVDVKDLYTYSVEDPLTVGLDDAQGTTHYAVVKIAVNLNMKSKDYESYSPDSDTGIATKTDLIKATISKVISSYSYEDAKSKQQEVQDKVNEAVKELIDSDVIYEVSFSQFLFQ